MSVVTVVILAVFVLPKFEVFFADLDAELPLPTRMLLGFTDFLGTWWWALLGGFGAVLLLGCLVTRTDRRQVRAGRAPAQGPGARRDDPATRSSSGSAGCSPRWSAPA